MCIYARYFTHRIHFEVDQLTARQCNDHLTLIDSTFANGLSTRRLPFIDTFIGANVANTLWIDLN